MSGCCESCGSNIEAQLVDRPHLCSIRTAKGWRQEIPLHLRAGKLLPSTAKLDLCREDSEMQAAWLEKHHQADAIVYDKRTGRPIQAIYDCPPSMVLSGNLDFFTNAARMMDGDDR
jgi:hypothetical protein